MTVSLGLLTGGLGNFNLTDFLITILVLAVSLSFHEFAHGWAAFRLGDDTAARMGRLSMNPLVHLDPIGSIAFILGGIGWAKPVPINPGRFTRARTIKRGIMLTSLAGPSANLILAFASALGLYLLLTLVYLTSWSGTVLTVMIQLLNRMYFANIILAVFNLLPIPPLDGFKIFGSLLPSSLYYRLMGIERYIGMVFLMIILFARGFLSQVLSVVAWPFNQVILRPLEWLFGWIWQLISLA